MKKILYHFYNLSPYFLKTILLNIEAIRRNLFRRYGNYNQILNENSFNVYYNNSYDEILKLQRNKITRLLNQAFNQSIFYKQFSDKLHNFHELPVLSKNDIRKNRESILLGNSRKRDLWVGQTSGSTGTPLNFITGKSGVRTNYAILDNYYAMFGCMYHEKRIRVGGARILSISRTKPPFWIKNYIDQQLQFSVYHIDDNTLQYFIDEINRFSPEYITGYAFSIYIISQFILENKLKVKKLKAVFTDSEGISHEQRKIIESAFHCNCYGDYGISEVGLIAVLCKKKKYHILEADLKVEIVDENDYLVEEGTEGRIIVTDLKQSAFPYIRYDTGDVGIIDSKKCCCGWEGQILRSIIGRQDDVLITPSGRKISRLSYIVKPGIGIKESQIVQTSKGNLEIRIVPDNDFKEKSLHEIYKTAESIIGMEFEIKIKVVNLIPRTSKHKFKHFIKEEN